MNKRILIFIAYIYTLSNLYSIETFWEIGTDAKVLPITADFHNEFYFTGFDAELWGAFILKEKVGVSWQIADNYVSQTSYGNGSLAAGASNIFYAGIGFILLPATRWRLELKQNFLWNQSAFDIKDNGILSETQLGTSTNINVFYAPSLKFPYLYLSLHNNFRFYPVTRNKNFQWEYQGMLRFTMNPYIKKIGFFVEAGFSYLSCDTSAVKYDSFAFIWDTGFRFSYKFKKQKNKKEVCLFDLSEVKTNPLPTAKKIKRPELYFKFYKASRGENVRIEGIYFNDKNQLTKDSCEKLNALVMYLKDYPVVTIVIVSYVENSGKKDEEIMAVSVERTNSIKNFLMKNGIPESQIKRSPSAIIFNPELSKIPYIEIKMLKK